MGQIVVLSLTAALNPTLLAATTVMLLLPGPERLMLGYWLGSAVMSVVCGLVLVSVLHRTAAAHTAKTTVSPLIDLGLAAICLILAAVLATGRNRSLTEGRAERTANKKPPKWQRRLQSGSARTTFVIGVLLSFPGASYLIALDRLGKLHYSMIVAALVIVGFTLVQLVAIEIPIVAYELAPQSTPAAIERAKAWAHRHGRKYSSWGLAVIGAWLAIRGIVELL